MPRWRTTISCRFIARAIALAAISAVVLAAPNPDPLLALRAFPSAIEWIEEIPGGSLFSPVIVGDHVVVALQSGTVIARRIADGKGGWERKLEATNSLAAGDDVIVVPAKGAVHGLDAATGHLRWSWDVERLTAPPLVRGGWLILAAVERLTALRLTDGVEMWSRKIELVEQRSAIDGDMLYVPLAVGRLLALELTSGTERWKAEVGANPTEPLSFGDRVYLGAGGKFFVCLKADRGREEWRYAIGAAIVGVPAANDDFVYTASMDNVLRAFRRSNGSRDVWTGLGYRPHAGPIVAGRSIGVPGRAAKLQAFDARTLRPSAALELPLPAVIPPAVSPPRGDVSGKLAVLVNDLGKPWFLILAGEAPPSLPVAALTVLPGTALPPIRLPE